MNRPSRMTDLEATYDIVRRTGPPAMVLVGYTPDGVAILRPLTPLANRKPSAPVRPGAHVAPAPPVPHWLTALKLIAIVAVTGITAWFVVAVVNAIAALIGLVVGYAAVIIGVLVVLVVIVGALFGRSVVINQSNSVRL